MKRRIEKAWPLDLSFIWSPPLKGNWGFFGPAGASINDVRAQNTELHLYAASFYRPQMGLKEREKEFRDRDLDQTPESMASAIYAELQMDMLKAKMHISFTNSTAFELVWQ